MKFACAIIFAAFLLIVAGCRKKEDQLYCPVVVSPANHSTFHSGDTLSVLLNLSPAIQADTDNAFAEIGNSWNPPYYSLRRDTIFYPVFGENHYATIKMILKASASTGLDSNYIETGIGGLPGNISCRRITIYIQP